MFDSVSILQRSLMMISLHHYLERSFSVYFNEEKYKKIHRKLARQMLNEGTRDQDY